MTPRESGKKKVTLKTCLVCGGDGYVGLSGGFTHGKYYGNPDNVTDKRTAKEKV